MSIGFPPPIAPALSNLYPAQAYGGTWDGSSGHDVGPAIQAAINAAAAAGGGTVIIPAGNYYIATALAQNKSGVHIRGGGMGQPRDTVSNTHYLAVTRLIWNGASGATMLNVEPGVSATTSLYSCDLIDFVLDGNSTAAVCLKWKQTAHSIIRLGVAEPTSIGAWFTTATVGDPSYGDGPGVQDCDVWLWSRVVATGSLATGMLFDSGPAPAQGNVSYNRFHHLECLYNGGDGIVFGSFDTNYISTIRSYLIGSAITGNPVVFANTTYTSPNGITPNVLNNGYGDNQIIFAGSPIYIAGSTNGATFTANISNTGNSALAPVSLTTNAASSSGSDVLNFASVSGVAAGMSVTAGGVGAGFYPFSLVDSITATTVTIRTTVMGAGGVTSVASGTACTFSMGMTATAVAGTYTLTAASSTTFNLTAPSGGNTQSGIAISGGVITFTDMVIPMSGTPSTGDSWTITVPSATNRTQILFTDKANNISDPYFEPGATGMAIVGVSPRTMVNFGPWGSGSFAADGHSRINNLGFPTGIGSFVAGGGGGIASGKFSTQIGGTGNNVSGFDGAIIGGANNNLSGNASTAIGAQNATDRGHLNCQVWAAGDLATQGDAQTRRFALRGTGSSTSAVRVTANGSTASTTNVVNLPTESAFQLHIRVVALDHTTPANSMSWGDWNGLMTQGASASATALAMDTTPTPHTTGTTTGASITASADTTNGGLNISFTPPTGNTDTWHVVAIVETVEVQ